MFVLYARHKLVLNLVNLFLENDYVASFQDPFPAV